MSDCEWPPNILVCLST